MLLLNTIRMKHNTAVVSGEDFNLNCVRQYY